MIEAGYSPSVRLFEASACSVPVISDVWDGLDTLFDPGREILFARSPEESLTHLRSMPDGTRRSVGARARQRVLGGHTASVRARELERDLLSALNRHPSSVSRCS
jgi:spore maturation protein CgeB